MTEKEMEAKLFLLLCRATVLCLVLAAAACEPSAVQNRSSVDESTVAVLMNASVPLVTANVRYGNLVADSLLVLDDGTRFTGFGVQLLLRSGSDTILVRASEGRMRIGSGAVDLVGLEFRTQSGRLITAELGKFDGRNALQFMEGMRIDGRPIEPPLDGAMYRLDSKELTGCGRKCV